MFNNCRTCMHWGTPVTRLNRGEIQVAVCSYVPSNLDPFDVRHLFGDATRAIVGEGTEPIYTAEGFGCTKHREV